MKEKFKEYLESIGITEILSNRIENIYEFYRDMCSDEITNIFVTDYIKRDGTREYENLWFFSQKYAMEAKLFIEKDDFDITPIRKRIVYWEIQKQNYNFTKAGEKSRLYLEFRLDTGMGGELKASKKNCDYLREIIREYIVANLKE